VDPVGLIATTTYHWLAKTRANVVQTLAQLCNALEEELEGQVQIVCERADITENGVFANSCGLREIYGRPIKVVCGYWRSSMG
jgi:hypothetical protein